MNVIDRTQAIPHNTPPPNPNADPISDVSGELLKLPTRFIADPIPYNAHPPPYKPHTGLCGEWPYLSRYTSTALDAWTQVAGTLAILHTPAARPITK
jgi:hypothetical protein